MTTSSNSSRTSPSTQAPSWPQRRNRAFTLVHAESGVPIARLRPFGRDDLDEILYWSLRNERWAPFGPFGPTALPVEQAVRVVAEASISWAAVWKFRPHSGK